MEKYGAGSIVVSEYDPNWPALFEQESIRIKKETGKNIFVDEITAKARAWRAGLMNLAMSGAGPVSIDGWRK